MKFQGLTVNTLTWLPQMEKYLLIIFAFYLFVIAADLWLKYLNIKYLKHYGTFIPPEFKDYIDQAVLKKTRDYVVENTKFQIASSSFHAIIILFFFFGGLFDIYNSWVVSLDLPFILSGIIFFLLLYLAGLLLNTPFDLYHTFKIENTYGFTTTTRKLWFMDFIKSVIISTILIALMTCVILFLVQISPNFWWLYAWCFFLLFSILLIYIMPYVIEPLFNKFTPIEDKSLKEEISQLLQKVGIIVQRVFRVDASKRTRHTNAYFTGIGKVKRIVLYDTLLEAMGRGEILSILAHEAGHWKKRHFVKRLIITELIALAVMYLSFLVMQKNILARIFSLEEVTFFANVIIVGFLWSLLAFPFAPVANYFSRKHEIEADRFSCKLTGNSEDMIRALLKLSKDNLSNLHPHPLYAMFNYSHPPVLVRIRHLQEMD